MGPYYGKDSIIRLAIPFHLLAKATNQKIEESKDISIITSDFTNSNQSREQDQDFSEQDFSNKSEITINRGFTRSIKMQDPGLKTKIDNIIEKSATVSPRNSDLHAKELAKNSTNNIPASREQLVLHEFLKILKNYYITESENFEKEFMKFMNYNLAIRFSNLQRMKILLNYKSNPVLAFHLEKQFSTETKKYTRFMINDIFSPLKKIHKSQMGSSKNFTFGDLRIILAQLAAFHVKNINSLFKLLTDSDKYGTVKSLPSYLYTYKLVSRFELCMHDQKYCSDIMREYHKEEGSYPLGAMDVLLHQISMNLKYFMQSGFSDPDLTLHNFYQTMLDKNIGPFKND